MIPFLIHPAGILLVRLGVLPPVIMLSFHLQLHHQPAGLLLPADAWDTGVHHHDSPRHGGASKKGVTHFFQPTWHFKEEALKMSSLIYCEEKKKAVLVIQFLCAFTVSDSRFLCRGLIHTWHRKQGELWCHRGLQVSVPHVLRHGLLLLPVLHHHDPCAQQQGPASRRSKWVSTLILPEMTARCTLVAKCGHCTHFPFHVQLYSLCLFSASGSSSFWCWLASLWEPSSFQMAPLIRVWK